MSQNILEYKDDGNDENFAVSYRKNPHHQCQYLENFFIILQQLTELVLNGEGLAGITQMAAQFISGTILIFDCKLHLLEKYSMYNEHTIEQLQEKNLQYIENLFINQKYSNDYLTSTNKKVLRKFCFQVEKKQFYNYLTPILARGLVLGYVAAAQENTIETEQDLVVLMQHLPNIYALEIIRQNEIINIEQQFRWDFVDALFSKKYSNEESLIAWGLRLGHNIREPHRIIAMSIEYSAPHKTKSEEEMLLLRKDILRTTYVFLKKSYPTALCADVKQRIVIFLPDKTTDKKKILSIIAKLKEKIEGIFLKTVISFGIGNIVYKINDYFEHYLQAKKALIILKAYNKCDWLMFFDDLGSLAVLINAENNQDLIEFMKRKLGPLLEYDLKHHAELIQTLENYLSTESLRKTSLLTSLSLSGLKYRLNKIKEFGYNLQSPQERFDLNLALQIYRIKK